MPTLLTSQDLVAYPTVAADHRLPYGGNEFQFADLYLPAGDGPHPVVLLVHGGCWMAEYSLEHLGLMCDALRQRGTAVYSLEYRRIGNGGGWPHTMLDVAAGADHLRQISPQFNLDLSRVVAAGHSAGGHLVLWLAARHQLPESSELYTPNPLPLHGVASLAGVANLIRAHQWPICDDSPSLLVGGLPNEVMERYQQASPSALLPLGVCQMLINGVLDPIVPLAFVQEYEAAARASGDTVDIVNLPDVGHFEMVIPETAVFSTVAEAILRLLA